MQRKTKQCIRPRQQAILSIKKKTKVTKAKKQEDKQHVSHYDEETQAKDEEGKAKGETKAKDEGEGGSKIPHFLVFLLYY